MNYAIFSVELFLKITTFKVGDYSPWVSDYFPLLFVIHFRIHLGEERGSLTDGPKKFISTQVNKKC